MKKHAVCEKLQFKLTYVKFSQNVIMQSNSHVDPLATIVGQMTVISQKPKVCI